MDETEHEDYFIVAGLVAETEQDVDLAYKRFKKSIANYYSVIDPLIKEV